MPQLVLSSENGSCLGDGELNPTATEIYHSKPTEKSHLGECGSFFFEASNNLEVKGKSSDCFRFGYIDEEFKNSPDSYASDGNSGDIFLNKEPWNTCYASDSRGTASPVSPKHLIDSVICKYYREDQKKQFLSMKNKDRKMGERKERLKCVGLDPTYRAFMDDELSQSSQDVKKVDYMDKQSAVPRRINPENQMFPNREVMKVLDSASSRFSNFFSDSQTLVLNEVGEQSNVLPLDKRLEESAENSNFVAADVNLEQSNYESNQQLLIKANIDPNASLEHFTNDEISNSLEKIFTETASAESSNAYLKDGQEIEFVLESGDLTFSEKTNDDQSDISKILVIDGSENVQTIEIIVDEGDFPIDSTYGGDADHTLSVEPERINVPLNERGETGAPVEYVISVESDGNSTIPEVTNSPSVRTSECLYTELDSNNEIITYVNVPVSEINSLNQRLEENSFGNVNIECQSGYEIQENVLYSQQQTLENPNDAGERDTSENQTLVETKRDIISEAYLEAMTGCIDMADGGMLVECVSEENSFVNNEMNHEGKSQFMEISNNTVTGPKSSMDADNRPKNLPVSDEEMGFSNEDSLIVPKARKSLPSTPLKSTTHSNQIPGSIGNLLESKLNTCGFDSFKEKTENISIQMNDRDKTELNPSYSISDSDPKPEKSTARKSIRGKLLKSSSSTNTDSSSNDASNSLPPKRRKLEELDLDALSPVKAPPTPTTAMKTFVKPFTVAKKSVTEQNAYKTVFQALGVKTAMKTVKPANSKTTKDKEGKAIVVSLNDNELSVEEMSPDDSKSTPLCWSPMKELIPQKDVCLCTAEKLPCILNGETLQLICEAEDSIDGQTIPCKKEVNQQYLLTPSSGIKHKTLCDVHLWRLQKHQCCSKCGLFCTQGLFLLCSSSNPLRGGKESHFFHPGCLLVPGAGLPPSCPHCCRFSEFKNVKLVLLERETEDSSHNLDKNTDAKSITNGLENYSIVMQTINVEPKKPLNGSFTAVSQKQELQSMVMAITGEKSLHLRPAGKCLLNPIKNGDVKKVLQLIVNGVNPNHKFKTHKNNTPLHIGAYYGFTGIVSILIQFGADIDALNDDLETPLILAVERNQFAIVRYLVFAGAQVNVKNENGLNAFHVAAKKGSKEIGEFLYNTGKFGVNIQDDGGWTPLVWACEKGFTDYIEWLLELGADPNVRDNEENTALHWAACTGDSDILTMFLDHGCNLTFVNQRGDSALHIAARKDNFSCVKLLLKRDAPVDVKNKEGETPLQCCDMGTKSLRMLKRHVSNVLRMEKVPLLHNVVYRDISRGAEAFPIQAVNEVDTEEFIMDFRYIIRNCYASGLRIVATVDSMEVCHCKDNCSSNNCTCIKLSKCWYDMNGLLLSDFDLRDPPSIYECNKTCHCPKTCINRIVQQGLKIPLQVFRSLTMGWGVRTLKELPKGTFVCEYIGEVLGGKEIAQREDDSYLFNLESKTGDVCLDGRFYGNVARFINHSCDPNLVGVRVFIEHQDLNFPRIAFFTLRNVEAYEELSFDYGIHFWIVKSQTTLCTCNATSCKYSKDSIDDTLQNFVDQKLRT